MVTITKASRQGNWQETMETWGIMGWRRMVWWLSGTRMWFPSAQIRGGGSHWMVGSSVNVLVSGIKAEVFLLLFNRRLGPFRDEQISKKNPVRSFITGQEPMNRPLCPGCFLFWLKSCCIKKNSAFNVISRPFPWLWEIWVRDYMRVRIYPWLLILLNFCSILEFPDAADLYIPKYPTSSCAPPPLPQRKWVPPLPLSLRGRARLQVGQSEWQVRKDPLCSLCCV